ncbi:endo alpha-1,4 polygalactosaminidase [Fusobacterium simiae]|uniref:Endo alpha-1,4 polygalactosaminidase n=1 Tax=Fusobacterium simiae TaxID=855 RepID=A0ABT4DK93_FUSSI|nr:endo alpha-1,4 polygalactosaminidase [Fusobacterium simiae]MCY7009024.1 endo alpha-1,4 polygalactosaminidase [Fusobacterium simiae]
MKKHLILCCYFILFNFIFSQEIYRDRMRDFIRELKENTSDDKIFITQNGNALYFRDGEIDEDFFSVTDGTTQESLFYGDELKFNKLTSLKLKKELLNMLVPIKESGKVVLAINYGKGEKTKKNLENENKKFDFIVELLPSFEAKEIYQPMEEFNQNDIYSLKDAKNFLCLLNPEKFETLEEYKNSLESTDFDILIIEPSINGEFFSAEQIEGLKQKSSGSKRLVIAYFSIGEAEDYRYYWEKSWNKKHPDWIAEENGDWNGNYRVKYWSPEWKKIVKDYQRKLDEIGVDGYLLDTVDTYYYFEDKDEAKQSKNKKIRKIKNNLRK